MPVIVVASLDLMTWMVAIASSNVIPSFLSGEYFGSAMSSNLFHGKGRGRGRDGQDLGSLIFYF
tara:strand:- start:361 stop:552 length:192 start_codon:yes stop_codon:yes gene_type:complete